MPDYPDGRYDRMAPGSKPLLYGQPQGSWQDRLEAEAMATLTMSPRECSMVPCPLPQVRLFPPRYGYGDATAGITEVMNLNRQTLPVQSFSGGVAGYEGSSRNTTGMDT